MPNPLQTTLHTELAPLFEIEPLIPLLESGATIITPNNRLAGKIHQAWGQYQLSQGHQAWPGANIIAIQHWLDNRWQQLQNSAWSDALVITLSPQQELLLWEQVIAEDNDKPPLLNAAGLATSAQRAWHTLQLWELNIDALKADSSSGLNVNTGALLEQDKPAQQLLHNWIKAFHIKARQLNSISKVEQSIRILQAYKTEQLIKTPNTVLLGFQTIAPLQQTLLEHSCTTLRHINSEENSPSHRQASQILAQDSQHEIELAAQWAYEKLRLNPHHRVGIIAPELASQRSIIERVFRETFESSYQLPDVPRSAPPFNISTATPLGTTPVVYNALQLLLLNQYKQDFEIYCALLNNPFWGQRDELALRTLSETKIRELEQRQIATTRFREIVAQCEQALGKHQKFKNDASDPQGSVTEDMFASPDQSTSLSKLLNNVESLRRNTPKLNSFAGWSHLFSEQLNALHWPGSRPLDSVEHQQLNHWLKLLEQLAELDLVSPPVTMQQGLKQLRRLAETTPFQAETEDSPLQILGLLEGAGLRFDHLWIMGLDDRQWPPVTEPNPLLPVALQRSLAMPRSCSEHELVMAQKLLATYLTNSNDTVLSASKFDGDAELSPSSMLDNIADYSSSIQTQGARLIAAQRQPSIQLDLEIINNAPALITREKSLRGGSSVIKDQSSCPFNAFSKWRLGAQQPNLPTSGLSALDRGNILHNCLEQFWTGLPTQAELLALSDEELHNRLNDIITQVLLPWRQKRKILGTRFFDIEQQRLSTRLNHWLNLEKQRSPFSIASLEGKMDATFNGMTMRLRYDRLDITASGKPILIDYKTGSPNLSGWLGERPTDPQMPLYSLLLDPQPACISYAVINVDQQEFVGLPINDPLLPGLKASARLELAESWGQQLATWRHHLSALASEYRDGQADLTVYNKPSFTYQRDLLPFNRWHEKEQIERYMAELK